jgi:predicted TIM-barrel fold metal-dependent hydrolase
MPVLLHTWGIESQLAAVRAVAARYPDASYLAAHAGSANEAAYIRLAAEMPNIYLDPTLSAAPRGLIERLVAGAGADKVVWGSDCCFLSMTQQLGKVLGARISDDDKKKILADNAVQILARIRE